MIIVVYFFFFKQKTAYEIGVRLVGSEMCIRDRSSTRASTPMLQPRSPLRFSLIDCQAILSTCLIVPVIGEEDLLEIRVLAHDVQHLELRRRLDQRVDRSLDRE